MNNDFNKLDISDKLKSEILEVISLLKDTKELKGCDKNGWFLFEPQVDGFVDDYEEDYLEKVTLLLQKCSRAIDLLKKYQVIETKTKNEKLPHTTVQKVYVKYDTKELRKVENALKRSVKKESDEDIEIITIFYNEKGEIWRKPRSSMYDDRLDGRISSEMYDEKYSDFKNQSEDLQRAINDLENNNTAYYQAGFAIHELATNAEKVYRSKNASREQKRLFLSYAVSNVSVLKGVTEVEYSPTFAFLAEWMPKVNESIELSVNPENNPVIKGDVHSFVTGSTKEEEVLKSNSRTQENPYVERQKSTCVLSSPTLLRR